MPLWPAELAIQDRLWSGELVDSGYVGKKLSDFEYQIFRQLQSVSTVTGSKILIACSGGLDSVALVHVLVAIAPKFELKLELAHVHHGGAGDITQAEIRDQNLAFVRDLGIELELPFRSATAPANQILLSEEALRDFRLRELERMRLEAQADFTAFAHHADDVLETRIMRLVRGTGSQGLVAMEFADAQKLRPFLGQPRSAIRAYAEKKQFRWIEDPSNQDMHLFRNWIRNEWLPLLEQKQPGALDSFARSLETLSEEIALRASGPAQQKARENSLEDSQLDRREFSSLTTVEKRAKLANFVKALGARDFSKARIDEVIKRLHHLESTGQKKAQFHVGKLDWSIDATVIRAQASQLSIS